MPSPYQGKFLLMAYREIAFKPLDYGIHLYEVPELAALVI